jgi:DNA polymerase
MQRQKDSTMKDILSEIKDCKKCKTINGFEKFPIESHGNLNSNAILVSEAPGKDSLNKKKYWLGVGGKILRDCLPTNTELEELFYLTDIVKCWPNLNNENRKPFENEILNCSPYLLMEIEKLKPQIILSFGGTSSSFLLNREIKITKEHGKISRYNESTNILTLLHPSGIDRFMNRTIYKEQLTLLFSKIKENDFDNIEGIFENKNNSKKSQIKSDSKKNIIVSKNTFTKKGSFSIPSAGNSITAGDVSKNQIRITVDFKEYFPSQSSEIEIEYLDEIYSVKFNYRFNKSHILRLGSKLADRIKLRAGMDVKMIVKGEKKYRIE